MDQPIINSEEKALDVSESSTEMVTASGAVTSSGVEMETFEEGQAREVAYTFNLLAYGNFEVYQSHNAWWLDTKKLSLLFNAYRAHATDQMACGEAGISIGQFAYFKKIHPEFSIAKECCKAVGMTKWVNALNQNGPNDLPTVRWFLGKTHEDFKDATAKPPDEEPLKPQVITNNVQINVTDGEVATALRELSRILAGGDETETDAIVLGAQEVLVSEQPQ